ncbi:BRCA1-A complex subunit RAP80 isoform X2 [Pseudorasbora parva]|uniref:BRCA1-A complex subunit RAP80 isoform X2 n=1 Tax=Pseudorasbora parva TaxID=51549 RepID=UPI00351DFDDF
MPRRKRTPDESGRRAKVSRVDNEETLVISDSDQEEDDCPIKRSSRTARWRRRENKSQLQEMTEDEMLDLAMRLSAQEAAQRRQLEDSDIEKAIAESLNSSAKASKGQDEASSSSDQPQQNVANTISHLRRKLSYPSQDQTHSENERETTSPLPEMPDLSQMTSSHVSSRSSAQVSRTPATTQDKTSDKQTVISDTPDDELFKSRSESQSSPLFTRHGSLVRQPVVCVEKLSQELIPASPGSINFHTDDSTALSTCADRFRSPQQDSPFSKWSVFTQDGKRTSKVLEDKDGHQNANGNEDDTQIPDEDIPLPTQLSQGLSTDQDTCLSPSRTSQISSPKCVPENNKDVTETSKTPDQKQVQDETTQGENVKSDTETVPSTQSWNEFTSHMVLHLTDEDDDEASEEVLSPSPVKKCFRPIRTKISPNQSCFSSATITLDPSTQDTQMSRSILEEDSRASKGAESQPSDCKPPHTSVEKGQCTISYYWGVPFCPMGQSPDEYTRVIMCQMEVYEKSLKEAQRRLLRKVDWGQPVVPGSDRPFGGRRWKRHRPPQLSEDEEENEEEGEKKNNRKEVDEEREEPRQESILGSQEEAKGGPSETYVVLSSPEAKDEEVEKGTFFSQEEPVTAAANKSFRKNVPWDISDETQIKGPAVQEEQEAQTHEGCEEDEIVCPETQMTENSTPELMMTSPASPTQSGAEGEVMEVEEGGGASVAAEDMMEQESDTADAAPPHSQRVECPMCSKLFPFSRIQTHAAFCDGEADQQEEQSQVVARRKRTRGNLTEESQRSSKSAEMEKCFVCQEVFSPQEYPEHVELCLKKDSRTNQENGLLSALERTERTQTGSDEPGPSDVSTKSSCGLADPAVMGTSQSVDCSAMTFCPRSENTDCLSDSSKISQRLSRKRKFKR